VHDEHHVADGEVGADAGKDPVQPRTDLVRGLATGAAVEPEVPVRTGGDDLRGGQALVVAVVPLGQLVVHCGDFEAGEDCGLHGPGPGAGHDRGDRPSGQGRAERMGLPFTGRGQLQVGERRVPSVGAPLGLSVSDEDDLTHVAK